MTALLARLRRVPPYTAVVGLLLLAVTIYALVRGDPVGYVLAAVLAAFVVAPALIIWAHARGERAGDPSADAADQSPEQP